MDYRIIESGVDYPDVLVHRDRDEDGDFVIIECFGKIDDEENVMAIERVSFEDHKSAKLFIQFGIDEEFVNRWCKNNNIYYD